ncbi:actin binding protein [Gnomoniopsis smithogilvyi]|uniref:Actin binding protein n=1 Tax=Gnomoniopsis smithogilvyi TaxID=1191159 RepID=A0A9W9CZX3_9PEZI|nr:actin binding protein [Gnomoniopsis smithogilvyi]
MASLNLSTNGPSIKSSYQGVVNRELPKSDSPTFALWALFTVQAPLMNAFQAGSASESVLKVETKGDGELADLIEDFSEGRVQFAFVKVRDPNTGLPKNVLIAWCGGGVPERTKGYFTSHTAAVAKVLHGYHVQITARSDSDLEPTSIIQKVSDASGAKYTAGGSAPMPAPAPPVAKKPGRSFNPLVAARNRKDENVDEDGWGADAPPVTRTQLEKVQPAYKPTKVNISELVKNQAPSGSNGLSQQNDAPGVVKGAYQPVGKVDIAAIRAAAKNQDDFRPTPVKGSYEPVGKVDIAAIRARSQKPAEAAEEEEAPRPSLAERSAAFSQSGQSERLTSLPKPKVANKFGGASTFTGTKAPTPSGLGLGKPAVPAAAPVGAASRTFADEGGKTPAQLWAEKKARERGASGSGSTLPPPATSPVTAQKSGNEWKSGYSGKSWGAVQTGAYGRGIPGQKTGEDGESAGEQPASPSGGVSALKDRFKGGAPMGAAAPSIPRATTGASDDAPPPPPETSRPSGGFALPGLPSRPAADNQEEQEEEPERESSPIQVAVPVPRVPEPELEPAPQQLPERPVPVPEDLPREQEIADEEEAYDPRGAATAVAEDSFGHQQVQDSQAASSGGERAVVEYDYEKAEDNEIELKEGEYVTNIERVDEDWWMGTNSQGESGLFPSNYVTIVEDDGADAGHAAAPPPPPAAEPEPEPAAAAGGAPTATALFDYEAAEDNELSFAEGATITDLEFPDEDWWFGHHSGHSGLFPANYVQLDS